MTYIKLFLASSIEEFREERLELRAFIETLNKSCRPKDVTLELTVCEDMSNAMAKDRKQEEYNAEIRDSQYFYLLLGSEVGEYTLEEFNAALEAFRNSGKPKIYIYCLQPGGMEPPRQSVQTFLEWIGKDLGHYYNTFTHIDTVKMNLLLELFRDQIGGGELKLEDGQAVLNGQPVLSMENIPLYSKNETVQRLLAEKKRLDRELAALAALGDDEDARGMRLEKDAQRSRTAEQLHALEMDVLGLYQEIAEKRQAGRRMTVREAKAIEYADAGNYEAAKEVLRGQWKEDVRHAEEMADGIRDRIRGYIAERRLLVRMLKTSGVTADSETEILGAYEEIAELVRKHQAELAALYDFAKFLCDQNRIREGIRAAEQLRSLYSLADGVGDADLAKLCNLLGILYSRNGSFSKAEEQYRQALEIRIRLAEGDPAAYESDVGRTCNNLANLLKDTKHHEEAEALYQQALEIYRRLSKGDPAGYAHDVGRTCNNLAILLSGINRPEEAEALYREALEIRRRLAERNPAAYESDVGAACNNLANLLSDVDRPEEAEALYREALEIRRRLAERNPAAYAPDVGRTCRNLANLLRKTNRPEEAETLYREALSIFARYPYLSQQADRVRGILGKNYADP